MNKKLSFVFPVMAFTIVLLCYRFGGSVGTSPEELRKSHEAFLISRAPKRAEAVPRLEEIRESVPPNQWYELMEYFTMNPALGYPEPEKAKAIREKLLLGKPPRNTATMASPGEYEQNKWVSRGPTNVGGRTRVLLFDPTDPEGKRVFAGAVSGGLWKNEDITNPSSPWTQIKTLPGNLNLSCITVDPRDAKTWYAGTGEQYTGGDVVGTGVFKTSDAGNTWTQVLDVEAYARTETVETTSGDELLLEGGLYYINDIIAWDNGTFTEILIGVSTHVYAQAESPENLLGFFERGLYGSTDGGSSWEKIRQGDSFNDFEVDAAGNLWAATTFSPGEGCDSRGGKIFRRAKDPNSDFELITTIPEVQRTEIEASAVDPQKFYILAEKINPGIDPCDFTSEAELWITTDGFNSVQSINEPDDADLDILADDFTRGLAFYALMIESDPNNDNIVYAGGIDLFRSEDSGQTWQQISKWSDNNNLKDLPVSHVHADQHVMQFRPGNSNQGVFGHDGGVSFASNLEAAPVSDVFTTLEEDYVTSQFYSVAVAPDDFSTSDFFLGGTQDNGTQSFRNNDAHSFEVIDGDGAAAFYDQVNTDYYVANQVYNQVIVARDFSQGTFGLIAFNDDLDGFFINPQALDSNLDMLYSNGPNAVFYRYDGLDDLEPIGEDGADFDDPLAPRTVFTHPLLQTSPDYLPSISALKVSPFTTSSSTLMLGLINGKIIKVRKADGKPSEAIWTEITGPDFVGSISDIEFGQSESELFVTFYNYGVTSIWYSSNATADEPDWENKEGNLPDMPVLSVLPNPLNEDEVIVGTELGVWTTGNFSSSNPDWEHSYNGMSDVKVTDLELQKGSSEVFAASYGRGIFSGHFKTALEEEAEKGGLDILVTGVYPTVSEGNYQVISSAELGMTEILVFDVQGQLVQMVRHQIEANIPVDLSLPQVARGVYFVRIESPEKVVVEKIVKL